MPRVGICFWQHSATVLHTTCKCHCLRMVHMYTLAKVVLMVSDICTCTHVLQLSHASHTEFLAPMQNQREHHCPTCMTFLSDNFK